MHAAVIPKGGHATHAVIDVVAVEANEQHHHGRDGRPDDLQGEIALNRRPIAEITGTAPKADHAVDQHPEDPEEQDRSNAVQDSKQLVVERSIEAGLHRKQRTIASHPEADEDGRHDQGDDEHPRTYGNQAQADRSTLTLWRPDSLVRSPGDLC